jgi:hypothetical protein
LAEPLPFDGGVGPWLPLGAVALGREVDPLVEVVSLAVPVDVVGLAVAVDVVSLVAAVVVVGLLGAVDVVIFVETVVEVDVDGALVEVAPTSADASFGAETETDVAGALDEVVSTDASLGAETDTEEVLALVGVATATEVDLTEIGSGGGDAATDTPETSSARASTGAANEMRASAATHMYALFRLISRLFLLITPTTANS